MLGAMLVAEPTLTRVIDEVKLNAEDFYLDKHAAIFRCVHDLYAASKPVDELSVTEALVQRNEIEEAGGKHYVSELAAKVPAAGNAKHYAEIVQQNSLLRRLLGAGQEIQGWVHERDGEPRELSERAEKLLFDVAHKEQASDFRLLSEILHDEVDRLEKLSTGETELTGTPSGFRDIDAITGGFQPGNLIIVAATAGDGKVGAGRQHRRKRGGEEGACRSPSSRSRCRRSSWRSASSPAGRGSRATSCARARSRRRTGRRWCGPATSSRRRRSGSTTPPTSASSTCGRRRGGCTPRSRTRAGSAW